MPWSLRLALLMLLLGACERPEARPARLQGRVLDVEGAAVAGARVRVGSVVTSTRADGTFFVLDLPANTPLTVEVQSLGHSSWQDLRYLPPDVWSYVDANVAPVERVRLEDASKGGVVETSTGVRLQFPPGAVQDATGALVTGPVTVAVAHLDEPHEVVAAPGGLLVEGPLGGQTRERSWGLAEITLTANSQPAQLAQPVVLSMPLAAAWEDEPLRLTWLNPETSRWEEIAEVRTQDGRGLVTVEHFSWYDMGTPIIGDECISIALTDENGSLDTNSPISVRAIASDESGNEMLFYGDFQVNSRGMVELTPLELGTYDLHLTYGPFEWALSDIQVKPRNNCLVLGDNDTIPVRSVDADDDGFPQLPTGPDCDDDKSTINPSAKEKWYDGVDQDCSESSDFDQDGDGDNCATSVDSRCVAILNSDGSTGNDCDDQNSKRSSRHKEVCDSEDNDCDGGVDEDAIDAKTWFVDHDEDTFGDKYDPGVVSCEAPDELNPYVNINGDCDDKNPCAYPGTFSGRTTDEEDTCGAQFVAICEGGADGDDLNCDGEYQSGRSDHDGDDISACDGDCNDADASVKPDADEECGDFTEFGDPIDNDCDGEIDENVTILWYADGDGDGYGDDANSRYACDDDTVGWVSLPGDCDDLNPLISPERQEICDNVDNDCDGLTDDNDPNVDLNTGTMFYIDADGDTFGAAEWGLACAKPMPTGVVTNNDDCYDVDPLISPIGDEVCDGLDNNCDGRADDDDPDVDLSTGATFFADLDGDGYGDLNNSREFCVIQAGFLTNDEDCDDLDPFISPNADEVCDKLDNNCDDRVDDDDPGVDLSTGATFFADLDGDSYGDPNNSREFCAIQEGFVTSDEDCDDLDSRISPIADEVCDKIDNNCDDRVDDDDPGVDLSTGATFFADLDGDGYGDLNNSREFCAIQAGFLTNDEDCDDLDPFISPIADEVCDELDNNCDGFTDEDTSLDAPLWYTDLDGDGYAGAEWGTSCKQPAGTVAYDEDCYDVAPEDDPLSATAYPGAEEVYGDGLIQNCQMSVTDVDVRIDSSSGSVHPTSIAGAGDVDGDGRADLLMNDNRGPAYLLLSSGVLATSGADVDLADADLTFTREGAQEMFEVLYPDCDCSDSALYCFDNVEYSVASAGDVDGDGRGDILVGAQSDYYMNDDDDCAYDQMNNNAVYLLLSSGALSSSGSTMDLEEADLKLVGAHDGWYSSVVMAGAGDVDGDGLADIITNVDGEAVYLLLSTGSLSPDSLYSGATLDVADADMELSSGYTFSLAAGGDVNGDGLSDVLIETRLFLSSGALSSGSGSLSSGDEDLSFTQEDVADGEGDAVSMGGDVDGDGLADLLIDANLNDEGGEDAGAAYLLLSSGSLSTAGATLSLSAADLKLIGEEAGDWAGYSTSIAGDVEGDGRADVLVGACFNDAGGKSAGATYLLLSSGALSTSGAKLDLADADLKLVGEETDFLGRTIAGAGDVNGDGLDDVLVGIWGGDIAFGLLFGRSY